MAGFGFSIGDFFAVGQFAWTVYKSCKGAGGAFEEVSHEVIALHTVLKELEDELENPDSILNRSGASKASELNILVRNCRSVLQSLNKLLIRYKSLGTSSKKTWDRVQFGTENLSDIREKLMSHTSSLTLFLTTLGTGSLGRIEKKLDELIADVRAGRKEKSVLTMGDENEEESESMWNEWKMELVGEGFTKLELESHKHWIVAKLRELIDNEGLEELPMEKKSNLSRQAESPEFLVSPQSSTRPRPLQPSVEDAEAEDEIPPGWKGKDVARPPQDSLTDLPPGSYLELEKDQTLQSVGTDDSDKTFLAPADSMSNAGFGPSENATLSSPVITGSPNQAPPFVPISSTSQNPEDLKILWTTKLEEILKFVPRALLVSVLAKDSLPLPLGPKETAKIVDVFVDRIMPASERTHDPPAQLTSNKRRDVRGADENFSHTNEYTQISSEKSVHPSKENIRYERVSIPIVPHQRSRHAKDGKSSFVESETLGSKWDAHKAFAAEYREAARSRQRDQMGNESKHHDYVSIKRTFDLKATATNPNAKFIERFLALSLEEVFHGTQRTIEIDVLLTDPRTGEQITQTRALKVDIKPGLREGSWVNYPGFGNELENGTRQDVRLTIEYKPHPVFTIVGDDLHCTDEISLRESLCGFNHIILTVDGDFVEVVNTETTEPGSSQKYSGRGLPKQGKLDERGDLIVKFRVIYPKALTISQKHSIQRALEIRPPTYRQIQANESW